MFHAQMMQKINIMSILRQCKKQHHAKNPGVNSAVETNKELQYSVAIQECGLKVFYHIVLLTFV